MIPLAPIETTGVQVTHRNGKRDTLLAKPAAADWESFDTIQGMRRNWARVIIGIVLLTCVVCPVLELFDRWDHTAQTGNDTEYNFVLLGLCVGVAYAFALFMLGFSLLKSAIPLVSNVRTSKSVSSGWRASLFFIPILISPPILALRI